MAQASAPSGLDNLPMPRKSHRPLPVSAASPLRPRRAAVWPGYVLTALLSCGLGVGGTLLVTHRQKPPALAPLASPLTPNSGGTGLGTGADAPPAALTQGLSPEKAALNLGNWYEDHEQYPQAIASYQQAIDGGLDSPNLRTDLGVAYYKSGDPRSALEQYAAAQKQDPNHENSLFNQGSAYATLGDRRRALAAWRQYLKRFPQGQHVQDARNFMATLQSSPSPQ